MGSRLPRRLLGYALVLLAAISLNFFLPRWMPGDPLALIAGNSVRQMSPAVKDELRQAYGLDQPLGQQYLVYLGRLVRGDLGQSYRYSGGQSVGQLIANRLAWTLLLGTLSMGLGALIGSLLGIWAARRQGSALDLGLQAVLYTLRSLPPFWLAMLFIPLLAVELRLFPSGDSYSFPRPSGLPGLLDVAHHAFLPALVLTIAYIPTAFAIMRTSLLGVLGSDYLRTARAKGLAEKFILLRHALPNTLAPVLTSFALDFGQMLGGLVLIETVFNYRGIGGLMFEAVKTRDYPLLQGGFLVFTIGILLINLLLDLIYPRLDPRLASRS